LLCVLWKSRGWKGRCCCPCYICSHNEDAVLSEVLWIVQTPVGQARQQHLIARAMVQFDQPRGDVAVLCLKHGEQGSDDAIASGGAHGML